MGIYAGIDIGTTYTKGIILDIQGKIAAQAMERTGIDLKHIAGFILEKCLEKAGKDKNNLSGIALTGFGRRNIVTIHSIPAVSYPDVLCICKAAAWLHADSEIKKNGHQIDSDEKEKKEKQEPESLLILEIGGEKWKYIYSENAILKDFLTNDMCAVGTGKFLDYVAKSLKITIGDITGKALESKKWCEINQTCGVFVEAEIISKLSQGEKAEDLFAGMFRHMFTCIHSKASGFKKKSKILFLTGGVSQNAFLQKLFAEQYDKVIVPPAPQFVSALGAALFLLPNKKTI